MSQTSDAGRLYGPRATELTDSERHLLLSNERRRIALDVLAGRETGVHLDDLATTVANRESDAGTADGAVVERVKITLHHNHLPKMDELGILDYDEESQRVLL